MEKNCHNFYAITVNQEQVRGQFMLSNGVCVCQEQVRGQFMLSNGVGG